MATVVGDSGAWGVIVRELRWMGYPVKRPDDIPHLAAELVEKREAVLQAHDAEASRSAEPLRARLAQLQSAGVIKRYLSRREIQQLNWKLDALDATTRRFVAETDRTIRRVESLVNSAEMAGVRAELEVIEHLRLLPPDFFVFNDVRLEVDKSMTFENAWLKTAQVDHLVVGPTGVFTVETKCWSHDTAGSGKHHDPFDQSNRAGHLCYVLLRRAFGDTRVRSIIASVGSLPNPPRGTMVKVVRPRDLRAFIEDYAYGRQELTPVQVEQLRPYFQRRVGTMIEPQ